MNFMNRKMFQAGGGANVDEKYFFIDKTNKTKTFIDPKKLYNDLSRSDPFTITSFVPRCSRSFRRCFKCSTKIW